MSRRNDIKKLIETHSRNLQKLKEKEASFGGLHTPPHILTAIDDTVAEIEELQSELRELEKTSDLTSQDASPTSTHIQKKRSGLFWIATHAIVLIFGIVIGILVMVLIPTRIQTPASISTPISTSIPQRLSPITINIKHNISPENLNGTLVSLRSEQSLRELSVLESGKTVNAIPTGTYFFVWAVFLSFKEGNLNASVDRYQRSTSDYFEFHLLANDELLLVGFAPESEVSKISRLDGEYTHEITVSPYPWGMMTSIVSIPVKRIIRSDSRVINLSQGNNSYVLDLSVR